MGGPTFSQKLFDPEGGIAYEDPAPNLFSFNSPLEPALHAMD